jgi:hypothetical protein
MLNISLELPPNEAWALAECFKRICYSDYRTLAVDEQEAWEMWEAGEKVRAALAEKGIAPR